MEKMDGWIIKKKSDVSGISNENNIAKVSYSRPTQQSLNEVQAELIAQYH